MKGTFFPYFTGQPWGDLKPLMKSGIGYITSAEQAEIHDGFYKSDILNSSLKTTHTLNQIGNTSFEVRYKLPIITSD